MFYMTLWQATVRNSKRRTKWNGKKLPRLVCEPATTQHAPQKTTGISCISEKPERNNKINYLYEIILFVVLHGLHAVVLRVPHSAVLGRKGFSGSPLTGHIRLDHRMIECQSSEINSTDISRNLTSTTYICARPKTHSKIHKRKKRKTKTNAEKTNIVLELG